ncbi:MAG: tetratricopeptide repeat protein [Bacteroidia bacterium]|nr:tetratricopeptide repeat protein [Bacteroidia bacterium]MDW8088557.1 tetratricopeptide repeat protein [Bacteroidia bacterium]
MRGGLWLLILGIALAQKKGRSAPPPASSDTFPSIAVKVYQQAQRYGDVFTQIYALHWRLAAEGASFALRDTLAQTYFQAGLFRQCINVVEELLRENPRSTDLLELRALAYLYLQDQKNALDAYEKLYELTQSPLYLYQVITLQFNLQRYGECQANIERLLATPESERLRIRISTPDGQSQEVPLRAAAWNVRGVLLRTQKEHSRAKAAFEEALKIYPDFLLAKGNLEDLQKELSSQPPKK